MQLASLEQLNLPIPANAGNLGGENSAANSFNHPLEG
jgi:hypothetical protein